MAQLRPEEYLVNNRRWDDGVRRTMGAMAEIPWQEAALNREARQRCEGAFIARVLRAQVVHEAPRLHHPAYEHHL